MNKEIMDIIQEREKALEYDLKEEYKKLLRAHKERDTKHILVVQARMLELKRLKYEIKKAKGKRGD